MRLNGAVDIVDDVYAICDAIRYSGCEHIAPTHTHTHTKTMHKICVCLCMFECVVYFMAKQGGSFVHCRAFALAVQRSACPCGLQKLPIKAH